MRITLRAMGSILMVIPMALLAVAFFIPGRAGLLAIVCGHVLLYSGYALVLLSDALKKEKMKAAELLYVILLMFCLAVAGPVVFAAGPT